MKAAKDVSEVQCATVEQLLPMDCLRLCAGATTGDGQRRSQGRGSDDEWRRRQPDDAMMAKRRCAGKEEEVAGRERGVKRAARSTAFVHDQSSSRVQRGSARPMIGRRQAAAEIPAVEGIPDCEFMRKTSPAEMRGSPARRASAGRDCRVRAPRPCATPSTVTVRSIRQTVWPGSARTRFSIGTPFGR